MIGSNEYNGLTHTFVGDNIINDVWANLGNDGSGGVGVTLGSDNWYVDNIPGVVRRVPLYNRLGGNPTADMTSYFYIHDRVYINDITIFCNFADGLVKQSNTLLTPAEPSVGDALPDYEIANKLAVFLNAYALDSDSKIQSLGSLNFPVNHFNSPINLATFAPTLIAQLVDANKCYWLEITLATNASRNAAYSTKSISAAFQTDRVLVWAEATLSHTWPTADHDAVVAGPTQTGWPT
jgi:hypothetical protein